ncbi:unnamed protein product [Spirodela intermedia]|uniref:Uncharacterized protein n=1 Tax=Spirodela intermedia TaxID=51605 RepID=A0ABN7ECX0_SPIIN|nr:unnamed protein product [Spirodela intermedia]
MTQIITNEAEIKLKRENTTFGSLGSCHLMERSWMEVGHVSGASSSGPRNKRRLFIASTSRSSPCSRLLPDCASDPLAGPDFWGCMIISSLINVLEIISALPLST